jgi:Domain of unknown function (DUF4157)
MALRDSIPGKPIPKRDETFNSLSTATTRAMIVPPGHVAGERRSAPAFRAQQQSFAQGRSPRPPGRTRGERLTGAIDGGSHRSLREARAQDRSELAPPIVHEALREPGTALPPLTRALYEARLGADLGHVRLHTGEGAAASAHAVGAQAYAVGSDVVFERDRYTPQSPAGRSLFLHEFALCGAATRRAASSPALRGPSTRSSIHGGMECRRLSGAASRRRPHSRAPGQ